MTCSSGLLTMKGTSSIASLEAEVEGLNQRNSYVAQVQQEHEQLVV